MNAWDAKELVEAETALDAVKKAFERLYFSFDPECTIFDDGCLFYSNMVDIDNIEATESEIEKWKNGELKLYSANSTIEVFELVKTQIVN